jgi:transposase
VEPIKQQYKNTLSVAKNQQLVLPMGIAFQIPEDSPVRLLWEILEGIDFTAMESGFERSRNSTPSAREMTALVVFGAMNQVYSSRGLETAAGNDIRYMWLLDGKRAPDHSTIARFRAERLPQVMESLFGQLLGWLREEGEIDYETVFIDGSKLEANANRYSFVWKKSVEKHLAKLREKAADILAGTEPSPDGLRALAHKNRAEMAALGIREVSGKGRHKSRQQKAAEELEQMAAKWEEYEHHLSIMGEGRNSYSKTDPDATFMRMKDDHMRNGQLKAAYNMQLAVNSEYIVGYGAFEDRNDSDTLIPFLAALEVLHRRRYESVTTDAGYESHENYTYLQSCEQLSFIKPANYETSKRKKQKWVGRFEDMAYDHQADTFTCQAGKTLRFIAKHTRKSKTGFESLVSTYSCTECAGCELRTKCSRAHDENTKQLGVCWEFQLQRARSLANISSAKGIQYRVNRSIQVEGAFGVIKQDWGFRRFLTRGRHNILTEFGILAFAFNISKLHAKRRQNRTGTQLFEVNIA